MSPALSALKQLAEAADVYSAEQESAKDKRCGNVQPITVAEGNALRMALDEAWAVIENEGANETNPSGATAAELEPRCDCCDARNPVGVLHHMTPPAHSFRIVPYDLCDLCYNSMVSNWYVNGTDQMELGQVICNIGNTIRSDLHKLNK